jgi:hypothetical protein
MRRLFAYIVWILGLRDPLVSCCRTATGRNGTGDGRRPRQRCRGLAGTLHASLGLALVFLLPLPLPLPALGSGCGPGQVDLSPACPR